VSQPCPKELVGDRAFEWAGDVVDRKKKPNAEEEGEDQSLAATKKKRGISNKKVGRTATTQMNEIQGIG